LIIYKRPTTTEQELANYK